MFINRLYHQASAGPAHGQSVRILANFQERPFIRVLSALSCLGYCFSLSVCLFVCFFTVSYDEFSFIIINLICCVYVVNFSMLSDEYFLHQYFEDRFLL